MRYNSGGLLGSSYRVGVMNGPRKYRSGREMVLSQKTTKYTEFQLEYMIRGMKLQIAKYDGIIFEKKISNKIQISVSGREAPVLLYFFWYFRAFLSSTDRPPAERRRQRSFSLHRVVFFNLLIESRGRHLLQGRGTWDQKNWLQNNLYTQRTPEKNLTRANGAEVAREYGRKPPPPRGVARVGERTFKRSLFDPRGGPDRGDSFHLKKT